MGCVPPIVLYLLTLKVDVPSWVRTWNLNADCIHWSLWKLSGPRTAREPIPIFEAPCVNWVLFELTNLQKATKFNILTNLLLLAEIQIGQKKGRKRLVIYLSFLPWTMTLTRAVQEPVAIRWNGRLRTDLGCMMCYEVGQVIVREHVHILFVFYTLAPCNKFLFHGEGTYQCP